MTIRAVLGGLALVAALAGFGVSAGAAEAGPPACARIFFRPLPSGMSDGEQDAGVYTSRFTHLELKATVKSGEAQDYYVASHNDRLAALAGAVPAVAQSCAKQKGLPNAAGKSAGTCRGQRFAVAIAHSGKQKIVLLYGLDGSQWRFCSAGTL